MAIAVGAGTVHVHTGSPGLQVHLPYDEYLTRMSPPDAYSYMSDTKLLAAENVFYIIL